MNERIAYDDDGMEERPDWVMVGVPNGARVRIFASTELTKGQLEYFADMWDTPITEPVRRPINQRYVVTVEMKRFVVVESDTYAEAFRHLFEQWEPKAPERAAISPAQKRIKP